MNNITISGNVGQDPELRYFDDGKCVANFSVAVRRRGRDKEPDWFTCEAWNKTAQIIGDYVRKGTQISLAGRMQCDKYEKEGQKREKWKLVVNEMTLLGRKGDGEPATAAPATPTAGVPRAPYVDDPF